jgi:hypothetical protein
MAHRLLFYFTVIPTAEKTVKYSSLSIIFRVIILINRIYSIRIDGLRTFYIKKLERDDSVVEFSGRF